MKDLSGITELTDGQWDAIEALIPLVGKQHEWEVSSRRGKKCLWEREEDAPFIMEEALRALDTAIEGSIDDYDLTDEQKKALKSIFGQGE